MPGASARPSTCNPTRPAPAPGLGLSRTATQACQLALIARMHGLLPSDSRLLRRELPRLPALPKVCRPLALPPSAAAASGGQVQGHAAAGWLPLRAVGTASGSVDRLTAARRAAAVATAWPSGPAGAGAPRGVQAPLLHVGVLPPLPQGWSLPAWLSALLEGQRSGGSPGRCTCPRALQPALPAPPSSSSSSTAGSILASISVASAASTSTSGRLNLRLVLCTAARSAMRTYCRVASGSGFCGSAGRCARHARLSKISTQRRLNQGPKRGCSDRCEDCAGGGRAACMAEQGRGGYARA